jgi:hypothetical protein
MQVGLAQRNPTRLAGRDGIASGFPVAHTNIHKNFLTHLNQ